MSHHLVTGGNGFVGNLIVRRLLEMGEAVTVVDLIDDSTRDPRAKFIQLDILDLAELEKAMQGVQFVHHTAALVPQENAKKLYRSVNTRGTENVLRAAKNSGVTHLAFLSSSSVFGNMTEKDIPIVESPSNLKPIEAYGESKAAAEKLILNELNSNGGLSCSIIRPRTIVGPERLGIFQILFEWISEGRNIYIIGSGQNIFQFVHVNDVVSISIQTCLMRARGVFNVGAEKYGTLREALENLCTKAGTNSKVVSLPVWLSISVLWLLDKMRLSPLGPWHYLSYSKPFAFDLSKPLKVLGWRSTASNDEMLWESYRWYCANRYRFQKEIENKKSNHRSPIKQGVLLLLKRFS